MIDNDNITPDTMTYEDRTYQIFAWLVEDPFYSTIHNAMVKVDDFSNMFHESNGQWELHTTDLTSGMIRVLYKEWYNHQVKEAGEDIMNQCKAPNPQVI